MKTKLGLSWAQYRGQKRFLKSVGVKFECEAKERLQRCVLLIDKLSARTIKVVKKNAIAPSSIDGFIEVDVPFVYVTDLCKFVHDLLNDLSDCGKLTWDWGLPIDEIWLKIGGDHGGDSFKFMF